MLLTMLAEKIAKLGHASLVPAKASPPNTAWMGSVAFRITTCCAGGNGALAVTSQGDAALERAFVGLESARMATARSLFLPLPQRAFQAPVQPSLFPLQPLPQAASALTDPAAAPTSSSAKAHHLATAVALRDSAARPLATVKRAARLPSARAQTPVCLLTGRVAALKNTNARDLGTAIAAVLQVTVVQPPVTAPQGVRLDSGPAHLPTFRQMGLAEERKGMCAKAPPSVTAVAHLATVARLPDIALRVARQRSAHALLLTSHLMARVAEQRSTSVKAPALAIVAVPADTVESQPIIVAQAVNLVSVRAPR